VGVGILNALPVSLGSPAADERTGEVIGRRSLAAPSRMILEYFFMIPRDELMMEVVAGTLH